MSLTVELSDRLAVVTGGAGGMAAGIARSLLASGASVVLLDVDADRLEQSVAGLGGPVSCAAADLTDEAATLNAFEEIRNTRGPVHILVNNAGVASRVGMPFTRLEAADWHLPWAVNVVGLFNASAAAARQMIEAGSGAIVNIASVSGRTGFQTSPPYSATKAAVINFTQVMARDLAPHGIRVNAVCPGMVFTPFYHAQRLAAAEADPALLDVSDERYFQDKVEKLIPLRRPQTVDDVGHAVAFLASGLAVNITGQSLNVDGGLVMS